jgi:integrase/recombinase XerD
MVRKAESQKGKPAPIKVQAFKTYKQEYNENSIRMGIEDGNLTEQDAELIRSFMESRKGSGKAEGTTRMLYSRIVAIRKFMPVPFTDATITDLKEYCETITTEYKPTTQNTAKATLKLFYTYLIKNKLTTVTREDLEEIKKKDVPSNLQTNDLLTADDISKMITSSTNAMHRGLIALHAEAGCRISESAPTKWNQLNFDDKGILFNVIDYKTNKRRAVRLITSVPYLSQWKSMHPAYSEDAPVFVNEKRASLIYETASEIIKRAARRAGINKKVKTHLFRHSRVTQLVRDGVRENDIQKMIWGKKSKMLENYTHLCNEDYDAEMMRVYGNGEKPEIVVKKPVLMQCPTCKGINPETAKFCSICGNNIKDGARKAAESNDTQKQIEDLQNKLRDLSELLLKSLPVATGIDGTKLTDAQRREIDGTDLI